MSVFLFVRFEGSSAFPVLSGQTLRVCASLPSLCSPYQDAQAIVRVAVEPKRVGDLEALHRGMDMLKGRTYLGFTLRVGFFIAQLEGIMPCFPDIYLKQKD
jgi:hypothetical protein